MQAFRLVPAWLRSGDLAWAIPMAVAARLVFWFATQRVWEDSLITITHARNAVQGLGLTHHAGEPLTHGFTSAISVLVPLAGEAITPGAGLLALRLVSLLAAVVAIVVADRLLTALHVSPWPRRFALLYLALDPLQVFYGTAGMETQIAVAILLWSAWLTTQDRPVQLGLSIGLGLLARPDFALWAGIVVIFLAIRSRRAAVRTSVVAGAVVAPWLAFTTLYYGSPIPQTILAKGLTYAPAATGSVWDWVLEQGGQHIEMLARTYSPFFEVSLIMSAPVAWPIAAMISAAMWVLVIGGAVLVRRASPGLGIFVVGYHFYRVFALPPGYFDWYTPPIAALGVVLAATALSRLRLPRAQRLLSAAGAIAFGVPLIFTIGLERRVQIEIEDTVRTPAGQYLAAVVRPGEPVATEAAGYFGYYSGATLYDFPGLTSAASLAAVRSLPRQDRTLGAMIVVLRTPWIIVRPWEFADLERRDPALAAEYRLCRTFEAPELGRQLSWGGLVLETVDDHFEVRRLGGCPAPAT